MEEPQGHLPVTSRQDQFHHGVRVTRTLSHQVEWGPQGWVGVKVQEQVSSGLWRRRGDSPAAVTMNSLQSSALKNAQEEAGEWLSW